MIVEVWRQCALYTFSQFKLQVKEMMPAEKGADIVLDAMLVC